jgi:ferritin-like metal-binding protein YciE
MSNAARRILIAGLQNAHAMERQAEALIERQIERSLDYPDLRRRLREHLDETRAQLDRLETCLGYFDESPSLLRDTILGAIGNLAAAAHAPAEDEILKNAFVSNAFENYEIAAYKSLLALSERANADLEPQLRRSLVEEQEMAAWIDSHIREITLRFVRERQRASR